MAAAYGPEDPSLWITRKAGYWESQHFSKEGSHNVLLNTWIRSEYIDPAKLEQAYRAMIYNQPNFRADVQRDESGDLHFVPATDFSDIFEFMDHSESEDGTGSGYVGCWSVEEKIVDITFCIGSGAPLHKCYLVKGPHGYNLLNKFHHGIGDGTTGFRVVNEVLRQYDLLMSGEEVDLKPAKVTPSAEDLCRSAKNDEVLKKMVQSKLERVQIQQALFPLHKEQVAESKSPIPSKNRAFTATGTREGLTRLQSLCKGLGVTVGAYTFAVLMLAEAAVYIRRHGGGFPKEGIPTIYLDIPVDLRRRLGVNPGPGEGLTFCIGLLELKETVTGETRLPLMAKSITKQLQTAFNENRAQLFPSFRQELKTGEHSDFLRSMPAISEFVTSNLGVFNYSTKYSWGNIESIHMLGSTRIPVNQVIRFHSVNDVMCYSLVCADGEDNIRDAREVFDLFVFVLEHSEEVTEDTGVFDFVQLGYQDGI